MIVCVVLRLRLCEEAGRCDCENREYSCLKCHFNFDLPCAVNFGWTSCSFYAKGRMLLHDARQQTACCAISVSVSVNDMSPSSMTFGDTSGCLGQKTRSPLRATYPPSYYIICDPVPSCRHGRYHHRRGLGSSQRIVAHVSGVMANEFVPFQAEAKFSGFIGSVN